MAVIIGVIIFPRVEKYPKMIAVIMPIIVRKTIP